MSKEFNNNKPLKFEISDSNVVSHAQAKDIKDKQKTTLEDAKVQAVLNDKTASDLYVDKLAKDLEFTNHGYKTTQAILAKSAELESEKEAKRLKLHENVQNLNQSQPTHDEQRSKDNGLEM